jgi:hypothetical protein
MFNATASRAISDCATPGDMPGAPLRNSRTGNILPRIPNENPWQPEITPCSLHAAPIRLAPVGAIAAGGYAWPGRLLAALRAKGGAAISDAREELSRESPHVPTRSPVSRREVALTLRSVDEAETRAVGTSSAEPSCSLPMSRYANRAGSRRRRSCAVTRWNTDVHGKLPKLEFCLASPGSLPVI